MTTGSDGANRLPDRVPSRWWGRGFLGLAVLVAAAAVLLPVLDARFPPPASLAAPSRVVVDRDGALLRAFTDEHGRWRLPLAVEDVDPRFITYLIAYEDRRFRTHRGVDPRAAVRAAWQAVRHRRIVSGASTLTMQTVRLMTERRERTVARKLEEAVRAVQLERRLDKDEILAIYLNAAPYGGNVEGLRAASIAWFGREPRRLTLAQSALLIALPQSPETRRPDRHPEAARRARDRVIDRLAAAGTVSERDAREAKREPVPTARRPVPRLAPHLARTLAAADPEAQRIETTLYRDWQAALERLAAERVDLIGPKVSAGILVADLRTGEIRASVGAAKFLDERRAGHVDMVHAVRSPGSTLKPFIYGLGMEAGLVAPGTLVRDTPITFAGYEPENFDETYQGLVTVAEALKASLNVPAVTLLEAIGPVRLAVRLQEAGALVAIPERHGPTLAIALGGFGTRLLDLAALYSALATDGRPVPLFASGEPPEPRARLLDARAARAVSAILETMKPPRNARPGEIAYKTGTSYGYRDAWAVGYDGAHVIAVWIGRPDGSPVAHLTGWTDAAPLLFDAFARIGIVRRPPPAAHASTADLPPPLRHFPAAPSNGAAEAPALAIAFPPADARLALTRPDGTRDPLVARVLGRPVDVWLLNGRPLSVAEGRRRAQIDVTPGHHTLTVVTAAGDSQRVSFTVE